MKIVKIVTIVYYGYECFNINKYKIYMLWEALI
jgi:hypothetical protein